MRVPDVVYEIDTCATQSVVGPAAAEGTLAVLLAQLLPGANLRQQEQEQAGRRAKGRRGEEARKSGVGEWPSQWLRAIVGSDEYGSNGEWL